MKFAICNETFQGWDWAETCHKVAELGYDGIEVAPFTLADDVRSISGHARNVYARTAKREGLEVTGLHWLLVSPKGLSVTSDDEAVRAETANYLAALTDFCADLGGQTLVLGSPAQRRLPNGDAGLAASRLKAALQPALARAEAHGIRLCLEPLPPPEADFMLTLAEAVALVERFKHPALCTIFDVKSASSEGKPLESLLHEFAPYIGHIHANDANRRGPGFGETDFVPILRALQEVQYAGYVSIEVFDYSPDPVTIAREGLAYLQRCLEPI
jgi:sugar phosphate isomerase/epimerase